MKCDFCSSEIEVKKHYRFPKNPRNLSKYGDLIHNYKNIQLICSDCDLSNDYELWTEKDFMENIVENN